jgi:Zn-dependent protease
LIYQILTGQFSPVELLGLLIALVLGITVHEFAHAAAATWLGDSLPRAQGRLTLAPHAHLELVGSLMFLVAGFGWGRPVQYNPYALRAGPRSGPAIVALAGPMSNLIFASLCAIIVRVILIVNPLVVSRAMSTTPAGIVFQLLEYIVLYNLILCFYNLIPVFPLDGFTVLLGVLPPAMAEMLERTRQYGFFILMLLIMSGSSGFLLGPAVGTVWRVLVGTGF